MTSVEITRFGPYRRWLDETDDDGDPTGDGWWVRQYVVEAVGTDGRVHCAYVTGGDRDPGDVEALRYCVDRVLEERMRENGVWP